MTNPAFITCSNPDHTVALAKRLPDHDGVCCSIFCLPEGDWLRFLAFVEEGREVPPPDAE